MVPRPDNNIAENVDSTHTNFDFSRLGVRVPVMLISPWIKKGSVMHEPNGPTYGSQFEHSSIPATLRKLFKLESPPLTAREEWAGSFHDVFLDKIRTDTPKNLPPTMKFK
jgi:phospholipase C